MAHTDRHPHGRPRGGGRGSAARRRPPRPPRLPADPDQLVRPPLHRHLHRRGAGAPLDALPRTQRDPALDLPHPRHRPRRPHHPQGLRPRRPIVKALVLEEKHRLSLRDFPVEREETLGPRDVRIKLHTVGICGSDVHYYTHGGIGPFVVQRADDPRPRGLRHRHRGRPRGQDAEGRRPRLHGAGHPRPRQPRHPPRHLQRRPRRPLLGDAAHPRHPPPDRRPPRALHLQAPRQRLLRRGRDGGAARRRRARRHQGARSRRATSASSSAPARSASSPPSRCSPPAARASTSPTSTRRSSPSPAKLGADHAGQRPVPGPRADRARCAPTAGAPTSSSNAPATRAARRASSSRSAPAAASSSSAASASRSPTTSAPRWCARPASSTSSATPTSFRAASPCSRPARST